MTRGNKLWSRFGNGRSLLLALLLPTGCLTTGEVLAWESIWAHGYAPPTYSWINYSAGTNSCSFTSTTYDTCVTQIEPNNVGRATAYINGRKGDAYVYTYIYGQRNTSGSTQGGARVYRMLRAAYETNPLPPPTGGTTQSPLFGAPATDAVCQAQYGSGAWLAPDTQQHQDGNGCTIVVDPDSVGFCLADETGASTSCYYDVTTYADGMPYYESSAVEPVEAGSSSYLTEVATCDTGSCVMFDGKLYQVDQSAIDAGSVTSGGGSWITGDPDGPYGSNTGYTGGDSGTGGTGGTGGDTGGTGGTGGGTGTGGTGEGLEWPEIAQPVAPGRGEFDADSFGGVASAFMTRVEAAPLLNMMPSMPSGSGMSACPTVSFDAAMFGSFTLDQHCAILANNGVNTFIYALAMFGYCLAAYRIVMSA